MGYQKFRKAASAISEGLPAELGKLVREDAQGLGILSYRMVPQAQEIIFKLELFGGNVCSRWHEDRYVCRSIVSYNCSATEYTANSNVDFHELYYCGNNDCIIRDKAEIQGASVGDLLMIKGSKFPGKARSLVHKSPAIRYHANGDVQTRLVLKVDIQDLRDWKWTLESGD